MEVTLRCYDPEFKNFIRTTFERAGLTVFDHEDSKNQHHSSIWITSSSNDPEEFKIQLAKDIEIAEKSEDSKVIVWNRSEEKNPELAASLDKAINEIRYKGLYNIRDSQFMRVVDDIRFILQNIEETQKNEDRFDMVMIYDVLETPQASPIIDMLSAIFKVKRVEYNQFEGEGFHEQINAVLHSTDFFIFYASKHPEWIVNLHREVWKLCGGASRNVHYLIATDNLKENIPDLDIPNSSMIRVEADLLPLEIKIQYDTFHENS